MIFETAIAISADFLYANGGHLVLGPMDIACPCCEDSRASTVAMLPFKTIYGNVDSTIYRCSECRSYWRSFADSVRPDTHYETAAYTRESLEERWRSDRKAFFQQILTLVEENIGDHREHLQLLDVGCSYGHMMEIFRDRDWYCQGTEIVCRLRDKLRVLGFNAYGGVEEILPDERFDAITLIDSFYCFSNPRSVLGRLGSLLADRGVMVIRIANRTPLLIFLLALPGSRIDNRAFGDQVVAPSRKAMRSMLEACGLRIQSVHTRETKPVSMVRDPRRWVYYRIMPMVSGITRIKLSPGLIYVCRKSLD